MTLESSLSKKTYVGNGLTSLFPIPFFVAEESHIYLVIKNASGSFPVTQNFFVDLEHSQVQYPMSGTPLAQGEELTVFRKLPLNQIVDLENAGAFHPQVLEKDGFDRVVMQIQQLSEELSRCVKLEITDSKSPDEVLQFLFNAEQYLYEMAEQATAESLVAKEQAEAFMGEAQKSAENALLSEENCGNSKQTAIENSRLSKYWAIADIQENPEGSSKYWALQASENIPDATELHKGKIQIASTAEAQAGTNDSKAMTPKKVREAFPVPLGLLKRMPQIFTGSFSGKNPIGSDNVIYTDWQICDGSNGTPDLRNRFVLGGSGLNQKALGGSSVDVGDVTGSTGASTANISGSVGGTILTEAQLASHFHSATSYTSNDVGSINGLSGTQKGHNAIPTSYTNTSGSNQPHYHSFSGSVSSHSHTDGNLSVQIDTVPPYYTLAYIMYIGA